MTNLIQCVVCDEMKPHEAFQMCSACYQLYRRYINDGGDAYHKKQNEYRSGIREHVNDVARAYYKKTPAQPKAACQKYYDNNTELCNSRCREYGDKHPRIKFFGTCYPMSLHEKAPAGYVWHHTCYDYSDPEANLVMLSRSSHVHGHALLRMLDIEVPILNNPIDAEEML